MANNSNARDASDTESAYRQKYKDNDKTESIFYGDYRLKMTEKTVEAYNSIKTVEDPVRDLWKLRSFLC